MYSSELYQFFEIFAQNWEISIFNVLITASNKWAI